MNLPMTNNLSQNANVAHLHSPAESANIERAMERERNPGRTMVRALIRNVQSVVQMFKQTEDPTILYIDHKAENITNALAGLESLSGSMTFKTGLIISNSLHAPEGSLNLPNQTLIIDEGSVVELAAINCKTLINLGTLKSSGTVTGMLLTNHDLTGDFKYGALHAAGRIKGSFETFEQPA